MHATPVHIKCYVVEPTNIFLYIIPEIYTCTLNVYCLLTFHTCSLQETVADNCNLLYFRSRGSICNCPCLFRHVWQYKVSCVSHHAISQWLYIATNCLCLILAWWREHIQSYHNREEPLFTSTSCSLFMSWSSFINFQQLAIRVALAIRKLWSWFPCEYKVVN